MIESFITFLETRQSMTSSGKRVLQDLPSGRDRIIAIATQMFANQGFAQVSIRAIAAEAECTISTVMYHAGSKQELLEACLDNAFARESELVAFVLQLDAKSISNQSQFFAIYDRFVEILIAQNFASPVARRLWMRLALDDWSAYRTMEAKYVQPLFQHGLRFLNGARKAGWIGATKKELRIFLTSLDSFLNGFVVNGMISEDGVRRDPLEVKQVVEVTTWLKHYGRRMLK